MSSDFIYLAMAWRSAPQCLLLAMPGYSTAGAGAGQGRAFGFLSAH